jgi:hypothetical protein
MYKDSGSLFSVVHNALMLPIHVHINTSYPVSSVCFNPSRSNINLSTFNNPRHQGDFARLSNEGGDRLGNDAVPAPCLCCVSHCLYTDPRKH